MAANGRKFNLLDKKEEKIAKRSKSCWQKNQICRKQLESQETIGKRAETKMIKTEQETKEKQDRSARNARRRCRSGTPGDAREVPTEHFQKKNLCKSMIASSTVAGVKTSSHWARTVSPLLARNKYI